MHIQSHKNTHFAHLLHMLPPVNVAEGPWITGGCARKLYDQLDWHKGDVDVFFSSAQQRSEWLTEFDKTWNYTHWRHSGPTSVANQISNIFQLEINPPTPKNVPQAEVFMETENATTFHLFYKLPDGSTAPTVKLQVIKVRQATSLTELWQEFDFHVCCFAADARYVICTPEAKQSADDRMLTVNSQAHNKNLPLRTMKYVSQGFDVHPDQLLQAFEQICDGDCEWEQSY